MFMSHNLKHATMPANDGGGAAQTGFYNHQTLCLDPVSFLTSGEQENIRGTVCSAQVISGYAPREHYMGVEAESAHNGPQSLFLVSIADDHVQQLRILLAQEVNCLQGYIVSLPPVEPARCEDKRALRVAQGLLSPRASVWRWLEVININSNVYDAQLLVPDTSLHG